MYVGGMDTASYSELRKNLAAMMDKVHADHTPLLITRGGGKPPAVLMSLEDFASYAETDYLLRSPANRKSLLESIAQAERGEFVTVSLEDLDNLAK